MVFYSYMSYLDFCRKKFQVKSQAREARSYNTCLGITCKWTSDKKLLFFLLVKFHTLYMFFVTHTVCLSSLGRILTHSESLGVFPLHK